jgi:SAM-dependent methyltransferase/uncharacterized protein YbaR (Trm112 family)
VRRGHFDTLRPRCPLCRSPLTIHSIFREHDGDIREGILTCSNGECLREYPIVDAVPILVGPIRAWLTANPLQLFTRDDLSPEIESLIGDVLGAGSSFDMLRQHVGIYASDHFDGGHSSAALLEGALDNLPDGPVLDSGCSVWSPTVAGHLTVGVDLNFAMLRVASRALREGRVRYAERRGGLVYERREFDIDIEHPELLDFWCCDVAALPFGDATFALVASINVLDCVASPAEAVREIARVVKAGGKAVIATPYDWSLSATPVEQWIGGHSQRGPHRGASEPLLRAMLSRDFDIERDDPDLPWRVRLHDRSSVEYSVHRLIARRK